MHGRIYAHEVMDGERGYLCLAFEYGECSLVDSL